MLITGVLVMSSSFADEHPEQIGRFLEEYRASTEYVNANTEEAAMLVEEFVGIKAAVASAALPFCNITFLAGSEMMSAMKGYLKVLFDRNTKSVGGVLPDDSFYYGS
jgi:NitT/TauT family transport system substrate-binding protein